MNGLAEYLEKIYENCKIPFEVRVNNNVLYRADPSYSHDELLESKFLIGLNQIQLMVPKNYADSINLLEFCIKDKYKEETNDLEKVLLELLENEQVSKDISKDMLPILQEDTFLIVINVEEKLEEAIEILKNIYDDTDTIVILKKDYVVLLGEFENIDDHTSSIRETLYTSVYEKCYVSYSHIRSYDNIKKIYDECLYKIRLAKKYNLPMVIFNEESLIFEKIVDGLKEETKESVLERFNPGFDRLDNDMIKTIQVFFDLDLNLSEAAKKLYVHRNTLIYRLDKIEKYTSYDIRKFNDAVIFKIAFFIWKQKNNI